MDGKACGLASLPTEMVCMIIGWTHPTARFPLANTCRWLCDIINAQVAQPTQSRAMTVALHQRRLAKYVDALFRHGSSSMVLWLYGLYAHDATREWCDAAAEHGDLSALCILSDRMQYSCDAMTSICAAKGGHISVLKWLRARRSPVSASICYHAARFGHMNVIQWARANRYPLNVRVFAAAAAYGDTDIMQWLMERGCAFDTSACIEAARAGRIRALAWLRAQGCLWDTAVSSAAASHGHLDTLMWLHTQGCPWDRSATLHAAIGGHLETLQWLHQSGCPILADECLVLTDTIQHVAVVDYLKGI